MQDNAEFISWFKSQLDIIFGIKDEDNQSDEILEYLIKFDETSKEDLVDYLKSLRDNATVKSEDSKLDSFAPEFFAKKKHIKLQNNTNKKKKKKKKPETSPSHPIINEKPVTITPAPSITFRPTYTSSYNQNNASKPQYQSPTTLKSSKEDFPSIASVSTKTNQSRKIPQDPVPYNNTGDLCLSMWQPWASLLVYGIKKVEGRGWYSPHRGRLWIASASKVPEDYEIQALECQYQDSPLPFPKEYPVSALLGYVEVTEVITSEEYAAKTPPEEREENSSEFLFICTKPHRLKFPLSVSGKHKIWRLDKTLLDAALKQGPVPVE